MANTPVTDLLDFMDGLVEVLRRTVPAAFKKWDEDAIHDARVATRRLKAAFDLLEPLVAADGYRQFKRITRKLRRRLGPLRDLDVMLDHLKELPAGPRVARAIAWASALLEDQRSEVRRKCSEVSVPDTLASLGVWWGIREEIGSAEPDAVAELLGAFLRQQLDDFSGRARRLGETLGQQHATETASEKPSLLNPEPRTLNPAADDPHALRIAGKSLRYTLELAGATGHNLPAPLMRTFKRLQGDLGLWHDFVVLHQTLLRLALDEEVAYHDRELYAEVLKLAEVTWRRSLNHLRAFVTRWVRHGPSVADRIGQMLPESPPAEPTAPDPTLAQPDAAPGATTEFPVEAPSN